MLVIAVELVEISGIRRTPEGSSFAASRDPGCRFRHQDVARKPLRRRGGCRRSNSAICRAETSFAAMLFRRPASWPAEDFASRDFGRRQAPSRTA
jgi:hypothetical protein